MQNTINYNLRGTFPEKGRDIVSLKYLGNGKYRSVIPFRKTVDGTSKPWSKKTTFTASNMMDAKVKEAKIIEEIHGSSLTDKNLSAGVALAIKENSGAGQEWVYNRVNKEIGKCNVDKTFLTHFYGFIQKLKDEGKSVNTVSHYKSVIRRSINTMIKHGLIEKSPIVDYEITQQFRERIWTREERDRIYNVMQINNSHLLWSVRFAERRPVRGRSDLWTLTRDCLVLVGQYAPYIVFRAQKTRKKERDTILPLRNLDGTVMQDIIDYFNSLPAECPYLFPRLDESGWHPMGNPRRHWETICRTAQVSDFHFHDLKHVAVTAMLDEGWTERDFMNLGIQFSPDLLKKCYYKKDAFKVLEKLNPCITGSITNRPIVLERCG